MPSYTRREFAKIAFAALPAAGLLSSMGTLRAAETAPKTGKPNSKVSGVQIGLNVPYSFGSNALSGEETLANCVALGVSALELRAQPVEKFLGSPVPAVVAAKANAADAGEAKNNAARLEKWRLGVSMDDVKKFRKMYNDAGVSIDILKVDGIFALSDGVLDYFFAMAKALGARAISTEIPKHAEPGTPAAAKVTADLTRVGSFADKHQFMVGYHGHALTTEAHFEEALALAKYNGINLDIGHYIAGGNGSPMEFLKKHHARVTHIHVKDRKWDPKTKAGPNTPFGQGDTPIKEVLQLIRDNKWPIQATIEFEYKVPEGSDRMKEIAKAIQYCRDALA